MENLYCALCIDRYIDPVVRIFTKPENAVDFGKNFIKNNEWDLFYEDEEDDELDYEIIGNNIFSCSSDSLDGSVRVFKIIMNDNSENY